MPPLTLTVSPLRRWFALSALVALGGMILYLTTQSNSGFGIKAVTILIALGLFWVANRMFQATQLTIDVTDDALVMSNGVTLVELANIKGVDRGMFALKPSNGFTLLLNDPTQRGWAPGLYWKFGRRIGIGGVLAPGAAKFVAETITASISNRK